MADEGMGQERDYLFPISFHPFFGYDFLYFSFYADDAHGSARPGVQGFLRGRRPAGRLFILDDVRVIFGSDGFTTGAVPEPTQDQSTVFVLRIISQGLIKKCLV